MIFTEQCSVYAIFLLAIRLCFAQHTSYSVHGAEIFYVEDNIKMKTSNSSDKHSANSLSQCALWCSNQHNCVGASYNIEIQECYTHNVIEFTREEVAHREFSGWKFLSIYKG